MDVALLAAIIVGALVVVGAIVALVWWAQWSPRRTQGHTSAAPPIYLPDDQLRAGTVPPRPFVPAAAAAAPAAPATVAQEGIAPLALAVGGERDRLRPAPDQASYAMRSRRRSTMPRPVLEPSEPAESPLTGTLRMLPGRLEVVSGLEQRAEIRFVHMGGQGDQRVTLGRAPGAPYEHVTLASQTVSRQHAALIYSGGTWSISNLSTTNPVRVNGTPVDVDGASVLLSDGDLVELGEVLLRFRI